MTYSKFQFCTFCCPFLSRIRHKWIFPKCDRGCSLLFAVSHQSHDAALQPCLHLCPRINHFLYALKVCLLFSLFNFYLASFQFASILAPRVCPHRRHTSHNGSCVCVLWPRSTIHLVRIKLGSDRFTRDYPNHNWTRLRRMWSYFFPDRWWLPSIKFWFIIFIDLSYLHYTGCFQIFHESRFISFCWFFFDSVWKQILPFFQFLRSVISLQICAINFYCCCFYYLLRFTLPVFQSCMYSEKNESV